MVKIATAITKLIHQFIVYQIPEICKILLIIYHNNPNVIALITRDTNQNDNKKKGILSIFNNGFIVLLIIHKINHHTINVFHASMEFAVQVSQHHRLTPISHSHNKITITYNIIALSNIKNIVFIDFIILTYLLVFQ